jgi:hypothetical protein
MGGVEGLLIRCMSLPKHMGNLRKQFHFTLFYTICVVFAFANSTIYFFITRQQKGEGSSGEPQPELRRPNSTGIPTWVGYAEEHPEPPCKRTFSMTQFNY